MIKSFLAWLAESIIGSIWRKIFASKAPVQEAAKVQSEANALSGDEAQKELDKWRR